MSDARNFSTFSLVSQGRVFSGLVVTQELTFVGFLMVSPFARILFDHRRFSTLTGRWQSCRPSRAISRVVSGECRCCRKKYGVFAFNPLAFCLNNRSPRLPASPSPPLILLRPLNNRRIQLRMDLNRRCKQPALSQPICRRIFNLPEVACRNVKLQP